MSLVEQCELTGYLAQNWEALKIEQLFFVTDKSSEGHQFLNGFTGIGGFLRWQFEV